MVVVRALLASLSAAPNSPLALSDHMVFDIFFTGGAQNFTLPTLKVDFWANAFQTQSTGDLLSQSIGTPVSAAPLPGALGFMGLGLAGIAALLRKRKNQIALNAA